MLEEASMNFDLENVEVFLKRVRTIIPAGFGDQEVIEAVEMVNATPADEEREVSFIVNYEGDSAKLIIRCFKDDADSPDLIFFTMPELAGEISHQMIKFCEERGI